MRAAFAACTAYSASPSYSDAAAKRAMSASPSTAVALLSLFAWGPSLFVSANTNHEAQARSQTQPVNRVDQPPLRFIAKTRQSKPLFDERHGLNTNQRTVSHYLTSSTVGTEERYDNPRNGP
jgi:hypothetical protein